jgi:hypothetical protein
MVSRLLYQGLSMLCFAIAILSVAPWVSAESDGYYCRKKGTGGGCDWNCPADKPTCETVTIVINGGVGVACSGCKK